MQSRGTTESIRPKLKRTAKPKMEVAPQLPDYRDVFLSHRTANRDFVWQLAGDIESATGGKQLHTWVDKAEIRAGQSIPKSVNAGLEMSLFTALIMTPDYFAEGSGWTDAEWHSVLHIDPDNRQGRIIPILAADCPYIPFLLRHLNTIDMRGNRYKQELPRLLSILRNEPLPRPTVHRGQLISPGGRIDRASIFVDRAVPTADPDAASERLFCNLLPVERLPQYVYIAPIKTELRMKKKDGSFLLPSKDDLKTLIRTAQEAGNSEYKGMPAFRIQSDKIYTFHEFDDMVSLISNEEESEAVQTIELLREEETRKIVISLMNMAISRHAIKAGLLPDPTKLDRYFFSSNDGQPKLVTWKPRKKTASRTVAKPWKNKAGKTLFWIHQGSYLKIMFLANRIYLQIRPTWVVTTDGSKVMTGPKVTKYVNRWTSPERNFQILFHVRFWTTVLRLSPGLLAMRAGDQTIDFSTTPAFVDQAYGIAGDNSDLFGHLDDEAEILARAEDDFIERLPDITTFSTLTTDECIDDPIDEGASDT